MREFKDKSGTVWNIDLCVGEVLRIKSASEDLFNLFEPDSLIFPSAEEKAEYQADQAAMARAKLAHPDVAPVPTVPCTGRPLVRVIQCEGGVQDWGLVYALMWRIVEPQARDRNVTQEQFAALMPDTHLVEARLQFWKEWADFFQRLQRPDVAVVLEKTAKYNARAMELAAEQLKGQADKLDNRVEIKMQSELKIIASNLEGSLASILDPSPTPSSG